MDGLAAILALIVMIAMTVIEIEHVEEIPDRRHVDRYPRVLVVHFWVRQIVAATIGNLAEMPVPFDEFQNRNLVGVGVRHASAGGERRDDKERDARAVTEEVERLNEAAVIEAATFVEGDDDCGLGEERGVGLDTVDKVLEELLQQANLAAAGMTLQAAVHFHEGNRRQIAACDVAVQIV